MGCIGLKYQIRLVNEYHLARHSFASNTKGSPLKQPVVSRPHG